MLSYFWQDMYSNFFMWFENITTLTAHKVIETDLFNNLINQVIKQDSLGFIVFYCHALRVKSTF